MSWVGRHAVGAAFIAVTLPVLAACSSTDPGATTTTTCVAQVATPTMKIPLNSIYANVWNAGGQNGEAASIAVQLQWRGIHIIQTGNDPTGANPPEHAAIRYGAGGKEIALTLAQQVKDATLQEDNRTNPSVDLVIGTHFALMPVPPPAASRITINVFNAFVIPGTASNVAGEMRKRGFHVAKIGNTSDFYPDHAVIIRYGLRGEPAARRVALQFRDVRMIQDARSSATVDVVIGSKWTDNAVVPAARATPAPTKPSPSPTCSAITK